jgi:hypothetical protein
VAEAQSTSDTAEAVQEPGLLGMALKDLAIVFAALSLWAAGDAWYQVTGLWIAQVVAFGDAVIVGLVLAALFHEWGHYGGAIASGANATRVSPKTLLTLFRFNFDFATNDLRQFHWMSYGGHVGHWSIFLLLLITIPLDNLGQIALVSSVFGFIVFATVIEYGIVKQTRQGADPLEVLQALTPRDFQQAQAIGALGGLFAVALLS